MSWRWRYTTPNQRAGYVAGAVLIGLGALGLGTGGGLLSEGTAVGPFRMNPGQGLVHAGAGALVLAVAAIGPGAARVGNAFGGLVEGSVAVLASALPPENILVLDPADAGLATPVALLLLAVAVSPAFAARKDEILASGALTTFGGAAGNARDSMATLARKLDHLAAVPGEGPAWKAEVSEPPHGGGGPHEVAKLMAQRTRDELYQLARERDIAGRSKMNKEELARALAAERSRRAPSAA